MDTEILQAIQIIDAKIASLREARDRLALAFGISVNGNSHSQAPPRFEEEPRTGQPALATDCPPARSRGTFKGRKEELANFILKSGPMTRTELVEKSGIPEGTVSYCLSDKRFFDQSEDGTWHITEFSKRGLERKRLI